MTFCENLRLLLVVFVVHFGYASSQLITKGPSSKILDVGENTELTCQTSSKVNVTWHRNGRKLIILKNVELVGSNLKINNISWVNNGNYSCAVINKNGDLQEESNIAAIRVNYHIVIPDMKDVYISARKIGIVGFIDSYPESTNIQLFHNGQLVEKNDKRTIVIKTLNNSIENTYIIKMKLKSWDVSDYGDYIVRYDYAGKQYEKLFARLIKKDTCQSPMNFLCGSGDKCTYDVLVCDNVDHCGDASDEKNCPPPDAPEGLILRHENFNSLKVEFESWKLEEVMVNVTDKDGNTISKKLKSGTTFDGLKDNATYTITVQLVTIGGDVLGKSITKHYHIPVRAVPKTPALLEVRHRDYKSIYFGYQNTQTDDTEYTTVVSAIDEEGKEIMKDINVRMIKTFKVFTIGDGKLKNGSTYYIKVQLENVVGKAKPLWINYTIPRMAAPGPVRNVTFSIVKNDRRLVIGMQLLRPADDGGSGKEYLEGEVKRCLVSPNDYLIRCETKKILMGYDQSYSLNFYGLDGEQKYNFKAFLKSREGQHGSTVESFFTTPAIILSKEDNGGISTPIIFVIIAGCCSIMATLIGLCYKCCCRRI